MRSQVLSDGLRRIAAASFFAAGVALAGTAAATRVVGVPAYPGPGRPNEKVVQSLRARAHRDGARERIEIFAADFFAVRNDNPRAVCVQNGIAWDADVRTLTPRGIWHTRLGERLFRWRCQARGLRRFESCRNRVAADLFFLNWYRTFRGPAADGRVWYVPNPAPEAAWDPGREGRADPRREVRLIFARRLVPEKGTRLFERVLRELLQAQWESSPNIQISSGSKTVRGILISGRRR